MTTDSADSVFCFFCTKSLDEDLFWLFEVEKVNKFLESTIHCVKICPECVKQKNLWKQLVFSETWTENKSFRMF